RRANALSDRCIGSDAGQRELRIGRVPDQSRKLLPARPAPQAITVPGTVREQVPGPGEPDCIAPDAVDTVIRQLDEVFEITLPGAIKIGPEHQFVGPGEHDPPREVNDPCGAEKSRRGKMLRQLTGKPKAET